MTWRLKVGFGALCLWSSLGWLAGDVLPVGTGFITGEGLRLLLIGLGGVAACAASRRWDGWRQLGKVAGMGLALVGVPALLLDGARGTASGSLGVVAFALVPVGVMLVDGTMGLLAWGLAGVAGLLVLLPVTLPGTARGLVGVGLLGAAAGSSVVGLVGMRRVLPGIGLAGAVGAVGLGSGIPLVLMGEMAGMRWDAVGAEVVRGVVVDLPEVVLMVWLVREVSLQRVSARYLVAPLLTVLEGWFVVRGGVGVRMVVGMALLGAGAYGLLRGETGREGTELGLR